MTDEERLVYIKKDKPDNPREYSRQLFRENDLSPLPDSKLVDLISTVSQYMDDADLTKFLQAQKKCDGPVTMMETGETVQHYNLRKSLQLLPKYMVAAESAGLTYNQGNDLLLHMLHSNPYNSHEEDRTINLMTRVYQRAAEAGMSIPDSYKTVKKMIKLGAESGVIDGVFYAFSILMRLGLSVGQACKVVTKIPEAEGSASGYPFPHFNDAIKSMLPAKVNPDLVVEIFDILGGEGPWFNMGDYQQFKEMMTFGCPALGITPNEMLTEIVIKARKEGKTPSLEAVCEKLNTEEKTTIVSEDRYFTKTSGTLEHAAQPYKNSRSLNQGIRDLEKLAVAKMYEWEEIGEGMWVFDPERKIWYSLGGKLEIPDASRVRHKFLTYDISTISNTPFLFHVHPEAFDCFIAPSRDSMVYPELTDDLTKFLTATPSRADYGVVTELLKESKRKVSTRAFIAHALGVTEFTYPNNIAQLEKMKEKSRDIRDQTLLDFDLEGYLMVNDFPVNRYDLVQNLIQDLNGRLPEGFQMILHPVGTNFENN